MALRHVVSTLTLEQATTIATRAIAAGRREKMLPLAVVVVDGGGQLVTLQRDDGCGTLRVRIAQGKARGALGMGIPSRTIRDRLQNRPAFQSAVATASQGQFIPVRAASSSWTATAGPSGRSASAATRPIATSTVPSRA
jgi:uncharacterized protein GlcG (DUF336 family)